MSTPEKPKSSDFATLASEMLFGILGASGRADKIVSRENVLAVGGLYSLVESNAPAWTVGAYSLLGLTVFRLAKAYETIKLSGAAEQARLLVAKQVEVKTGSVTVTDSQDTKTDGPAFE
jgi:hypothetical protein